jgi:hypothetical protein
MSWFLLFSSQIMFHCMNTSRFPYLVVYPWTFRLFPHLLYCYNVAVHMGVRISLWYPDFSCFAQMSKSRIVVSYGSSMFSFHRNQSL